MMEPPETTSPPNRFTPSRCALESRPFLELPSPFLCAIRSLLQQNLINGQLSVILAVTVSALVLLLALEFEDECFIAAALAGNGRRNTRALCFRTREHLAVAIRDCLYACARKLHFSSDFHRDGLHPN